MRLIKESVEEFEEKEDLRKFKRAVESITEEDLGLIEDAIEKSLKDISEEIDEKLKDIKSMRGESYLYLLGALSSEYEKKYLYKKGEFPLLISYFALLLKKVEDVKSLSRKERKMFVERYFETLKTIFSKKEKKEGDVKEKREDIIKEGLTHMEMEDVPTEKKDGIIPKDSEGSLFPVPLEREVIDALLSMEEKEFRVFLDKIEKLKARRPVEAKVVKALLLESYQQKRERTTYLNWLGQLKVKLKRFFSALLSWFKR